MHQVIQEHLAVGQEARAAEDGLTLEAQLPTLRPGGIGSALQGRTDLRGAFIEGLDELLGGLEGRAGSRRAAGEIQLGSRQYGDAKSGEFGNVRSQLAEGHGFGMRLEVRQDRNALEQSAGLLNFLVEFGEQEFVDQCLFLEI